MPATHPGAEGPLFDGLNVEVGDGARVGVLGGPKSGKTTLLRLICGTMTAHEGMIERNSRVSWPIPMATFLVPSSSVAQNIGFISRLYGVRDKAFSRRVAQMMDITAFLECPLEKCPRFVKPRLALALGIALEFDMYLFDGTLAAADKPFKEKAAEIVAGRVAGRGYVLASAAPAEVEKNCGSVYVLEAGRAAYFADAKEGTEYFKTLLAAEKQKRQLADQEAKRSVDNDDDEDAAPGDMDVLAAAIADEVE
jgi:capsular polysaccharide transport system ATP-binding protein